MFVSPAFAGAAAALAIAAAGGIVIVGATSNKACAAPQAQTQTSFAEDVLPIFRGRCFGCHSPGAEGEQKSGVDLTTYEGVMKGTRHGPSLLGGLL